jgi:ketosteroid isomerase-like protein
MKKRTLVAAALASAFLLAGAARADIVDDAVELAKVKAASDRFYSALAVLDDGAAMSAVWAKGPHVTFVGPRNKTIVAGSDALAEYFASANKMFKKREVAIVNAHLHVAGNAAWEVGHEKGETISADGKPGKADWVATNIYMKQPDGAWLMVSHHVQPGAQ